MSVKKMLSCVVAAATLVTMQPFVYAEGTTFSTASDFITDVVNVSLTGITSSTMGAAISDMQSKLSTDGSTVSYNGVEIGYWDSSNSSILYTDSSKSDVVIEATEDGYEIKPALLKTLLTDVNNSLIENYVPTSDDWSKIVGKYDVTLGDVTIPADQWITMEPITVGCPNISTIDTLNLTTISGIKGTNVGPIFTSDNSLTLFAWAVNDTGELILQDGITTIGLDSDSNWVCQRDLLSDSGPVSGMKCSVGNTTPCNTAPYIKLSLHNQGHHTTSLADGKLFPIIWLTDISNSVSTSVSAAESSAAGSTMRLLADASVIKEFDSATAKACGFVYVKGSQMQVSGIPELHSKHIRMFESYSCSKLVRGNTLLSKRISKLDSLTQTDFLTVKDSGWYVSDGSSIDALIGNQNVINAGDTADINAVAEVEPMCFNVIVPTTLPVYIDASGVITTATNATVTNKSNAAVKMTDINIVAKDSSGWTLVESNPSTVRDAMEFTFTTSLVKDTILTKDEVLPFTYSTELSPITEGADSLDLATVQVTVDWAD